jgi:hypothetical protein
VLDAMAVRLRIRPKAILVRKSTVELAFGTLSLWTGATHFFTKGPKTTAVEMSLHHLRPFRFLQLQWPELPLAHQMPPLERARGPSAGSFRPRGPLVVSCRCDSTWGCAEPLPLGGTRDRMVKPVACVRETMELSHQFRLIHQVQARHRTTEFASMAVALLPY